MKKNKPYFPKLCLSGSAWLKALRRLRLLCLMCLAFLTFTTTANAQTITVTGVVTEVSGTPMQGVNVFVKENSSVGTITGTDGAFTLQKIPSDATLTFSFIGYKTQEVPVEGKTRIDIKLEEDIQSFPEIVISAGYYSVKEKERTGSISKITAKEIANQPVSNVLSAVQGKMAGVNITQNSGMPGGGYTIQIRGINSLRREGN